MSLVTNAVIDPALAAQVTAHAQLVPLEGGDATRVGADSGGIWLADVADGPYRVIENVGQAVVEYDIYIPTLEGPFDAVDLLHRQPPAGIEIYGPAGALHGMEALTQTTSEHSLATRSPATWSWPAGITIGWTAWDPTSGLLWMAGWGMKGNSAFTTGTAYYLSSLDPRTGTVTHYKIPTDAGYFDVIGSNGLTGGAAGADVAVVDVDGESWVLSLATLPYNNFYPWHIPGTGSYPAIAVARGSGGTWAIDAAASATVDELHANSPEGADAFPQLTNSFGEPYYNGLLLSELAITPASKVAIVPQYAANNPNHPGQVGGSLLAIDPLTQEVLAQWVSPFTGFADVSAASAVAGTVASDSSVGGGTVAWTNPTRAQGDPDDSYATAVLAGGASSHMLKATNFGFAIPSNATIVGIVATMTRLTPGVGGSANIHDGHVWAVKAGTVQTAGTDQGTGAAAWPPFVPADQSLPAGTADLWGGAWTYTDINDSGFGVAWQAKNTGAGSDTAEVDAIAITVYYTVPGVGKSDPRAPMVDPTGTLGNETFAVIYDTFDANGGGNAYNTFQAFVYDHIAGTITPISDWLKPDAVADHWTSGGFDANGNLVLSRRIRLATSPWAIFTKADGSWQFARYPYAYSNTYPRTLAPDTTADTAPILSNFSQLRPALDPITSSIWFLTANLRGQGFRIEGDPHAPRVTILPPAITDASTYIGAAEAGLLFPAKPSIDPAGRTLFLPIAQWFKNSETWPQAPAPRNQYMATVHLDRAGKGPLWGKSTSADQLTKTTVTPLLPPFWQPGQLVIYVFMNTLTTDPAVAPITVTAGWTKHAEVRNGTAGCRYMVVSRVMQAGDTAPTFSWTGNANLLYITGAITGVDPTTPVDLCVVTPGPQGGGTHTFVNPQVTPSVPGCRILRAYLTQGSQPISMSDGELTPGEVKLRERQGTTLSGCIAMEEQLASTAPTRQREAHVASNGLNAAITIVIRPAPAQPDPPAVSTVGLVPASVAHGGTSTCTVTLASPATDDTIVVLSTSNSKATVQGTLKVPKGSTSAACTVNALTAGTCTISAKTVGATQSAVLTIT